MDIPFDLEAFRYQGPSNERCYALFAKLGFRSLVTEFAPTASSIEKNYAVVASLDELQDVARSLEEAGRFALRVVADGPSCVRAQLVGLVFSTAPRHARRAARARRIRRRIVAIARPHSTFSALSSKAPRSRKSAMT